MRAVILNDFVDDAPPLVERVPIPKPRKGEILVRVRAASVHEVDRRFCSGDLRFNMFFPVIPGFDISGTVETPGERLKPGDEVWCNLMDWSSWDGTVKLGGYAEFVCVKESRVGLKPKNLSFARAVTPWLGYTALMVGTARSALVLGDTVLARVVLQLLKRENAYVFPHVEKWYEVYRNQDVELVFDPIGEDNLHAKAAGVLASDGKLATTKAKNNKHAEFIFSLCNDLETLDRWRELCEAGVVQVPVRAFSIDEIGEALKHHDAVIEFDGNADPNAVAPPLGLPDKFPRLPEWDRPPRPEPAPPPRETRPRPRKPPTNVPRCDICKTLDKQDDDADDRDLLLRRRATSLKNEAKSDPKLASLKDREEGSADDPPAPACTFIPAGPKPESSFSVLKRRLPSEAPASAPETSPVPAANDDEEEEAALLADLRADETSAPAASAVPAMGETHLLRPRDAVCAPRHGETCVRTRLQRRQHPRCLLTRL
ncbi:hypothetical protein CTAYLR_002630 [Chrysophaeum taylorii]|uniref:Alcohol dehydrogenase-like N-terminal domain-containing protein n=1 Tax=Chrysophaeum taylorii TaxID=2483200 RepID=A0AAD7XIH2_9STRA|nr:hypothetical protein CTAYLR_002630 [Chrysophaeum taylorii]